MGSVKIVWFHHSNEDTKDEERKESWSARDDPYTRYHTPVTASMKVILFSFLTWVLSGFLDEMEETCPLLCHFYLPEKRTSTYVHSAHLAA